MSFGICYSSSSPIAGPDPGVAARDWNRHGVIRVSSHISNPSLLDRGSGKSESANAGSMPGASIELEPLTQHRTAQRLRAGVSGLRA